jgi:deoxyribonuclease V
MKLEDIIYNLVAQIPRGKITTYGAIAEALGDPRAARAVGKILHENPKLIDVPCHRVIMSNGYIGGYVTGIDKKRELLESEGIKVSDDAKINNYQSLMFVEFDTNYPLQRLRTIQNNISARIVLEDTFTHIKSVGGIDIAYTAGDKAFGAYVATDFTTETVIEEHVLPTKVEFPYIPTYLAYRELPIIKRLLEMVDFPPTILMLDGNGILHPRCAGIASHVGVTLGLPTIGVAKSLLCGKLASTPPVKGATKIFINGRHVGYALKPPNSTRLIYISPGHKISLETALQVVKKLCKYRIPEPLRKAHILSTSMIKKVRSKWDKQ